MRTSRPSGCRARARAARPTSRSASRCSEDRGRAEHAAREPRLGVLVGRLGPARRPPPRTRAWSGPRRCSRPCSRAGGGGRRRSPRGYSVASPRFGTPSRWVPSRSARRPIWSRRFQTSRWSPGSTSSREVEARGEAVAVERGGRDDLHHVAAAAREQEAVAGRLGREGPLDVQRRAVEAQSRDLRVRRVRLGLDGQRAALRPRHGEAVDAGGRAEHDALVDRQRRRRRLELPGGGPAALGHERGEVDLPVAHAQAPPLDDLDAAGHAARVLARY